MNPAVQCTINVHAVISWMCYAVISWVQFSSRWYLCAQKSPYALQCVSQKFPQCHLWNCSSFHLTDDGPLSSFHGRSSRASSFHTSLFQAANSVMSLALYPQVVSQAPQHFICSKKKATCEGCFTCQFICLVISLLSGKSRAIYPQAFSKVDVDHWHIPAWACYSTGSKQTVQYVFLTRHSRRSGGIAIPVPAIHKLIQSMHWRCPAVMDSWGGNTRCWSTYPSVTKYWLTDLISWRRSVL